MGLLKKLLIIFGFSLFLFGWAAGMGAHIPEWLYGSALSKIEYPFGDHLAIASDQLGKIYVGDGYYGRVQRYSSKGEFELGWFVKTGGGVFILRSIDKNRLEVAAAREGLLTYSSDGRLLSEIQNRDIYTLYATKVNPEPLYSVKGFCFPCVVNTQSGKIVIATPWPKCLIAAPFPSFGYCFLGLVLIAAVECQRRRRIRRQNVPQNPLLSPLSLPPAAPSPGA